MAAGDCNVDSGTCGAAATLHRVHNRGGKLVTDYLARGGKLVTDYLANREGQEQVELKKFCCFWNIDHSPCGFLTSPPCGFLTSLVFFKKKNDQTCKKKLTHFEPCTSPSGKQKLSFSGKKAMGARCAAAPAKRGELAAFFDLQGGGREGRRSGDCAGQQLWPLCSCGPQPWWGGARFSKGVALG